MHRSRWLPIAVTLGAACADPLIAPMPRPLPSVQAGAGSSASAAAVPVSISVAKNERVAVIGGELVDLTTVEPRLKLTSELVLASDVSDGVAYLTVRVGEGAELRAHDTADGRLLWSQAVAGCRQPVASASGVFCESDAGLSHFSRGTGKVQQLGPETEVTGLIGLEGRLLALTSSSTVVALDAMSGEVLGSLKLRHQPVSGFTRRPLVRAGSLVCGASSNDKTTDLTCFDGTPSLVHSEAIAVPQGALQQADADVLVVSSWQGARSCEVLATSSGASMGRTKNRCAAGIASSGSLEGMLLLHPKLELLDARGSVRWSSEKQTRSSFDAAKVVRVGTTLVIARYNPIATGTQLFAVDAATGALVWTADVESLPIAHSKYSNRVELEVTSRGLMLVGREAGQEFVQLFDATSGRRIASVLRGR